MQKATYEELLKENEQLKAKFAARSSRFSVLLQTNYTFESCVLPTPQLRPNINDKNADLSKCDLGTLSYEEINRYSRQLLFQKHGIRGQLLLRATRILVVGAGGLGSSVIPPLAGAGFGFIGIVDNDVVDITNLHRQTIHSVEAVGINKAVSAAVRVFEINPLVRCEPYPFTIDQTNVLAFFRAFDIVIDATDNVAARYLLSDAAVFCDKPLISAAAIRLDGQISVYHYAGGPCYRCINPIPTDPSLVSSCANDGILPTTPAIMGSIEALEAIKIAANFGTILSEKMLVVSGSTSLYKTVKLRSKQPNCAVCGTNPSIIEPIDYLAWCGKKIAYKHEDYPDVTLISCEQLREKMISKKMSPSITAFVDIRPINQLEISSISLITQEFKTLHFPLSSIHEKLILETLVPFLSLFDEVVFLSRQGGEASFAVSKMCKMSDSFEKIQKDRIYVLEGGLERYARLFPNECAAY